MPRDAVGSDDVNVNLLLVLQLAGVGGDDDAHDAPADEVELAAAIAGDHLRVMDAEVIADQDELGLLTCFDAGLAVEAEELRREVGHAAVEHGEAAERVLVGDLLMERLHRQLSAELLDAAQ